MAQFLYICKTGFSFDFLEQNRTEQKTEPNPNPNPNLNNVWKENKAEQQQQRRQTVKRIEILAPSKSSSKEFSLIRRRVFLSRLGSHPSRPFWLSVCLSLFVCLYLSPQPLLCRAHFLWKKGTHERQLVAR